MYCITPLILIHVSICYLRYINKISDEKFDIFCILFLFYIPIQTDKKRNIESIQ